jgi:queuine tRNA-ribosyltransferase
VASTRILSAGPARLATRQGDVPLPVFVPDATRAVIRSVPTSSLSRSRVEALLVSTAHLATQPGTSVVSALGGVRSFMGWNGPLISDSGGFQAFSLLSSGRTLATVSDAGLSYRFSTRQRYRQLTPKSCIEAQLRLGSDIVYCLDYCTHPNAAAAEQDRSVELTLRWAAECRAVFDQLLASKPADKRPLLFAVVQGGSDPDRRARCAEALAETGFDGYGFGGYPIVDGCLVDEVAQVAELVPPGSVLHGLGIGTPENLVKSWRAGYGIFDCTLPTRNGRRGVVYTELQTTSLGEPGFYRIARLTDERWVRQRRPVDVDCDCDMCELPAGYVAHLFRLEEALGGTLASLHNLRFYTRLTEELRRLQSRGQGTGDER